MMEYVITRSSSDELYHFGIKGQKWGVRRYENDDGTLTEEGKARYRKDAAEARKEIGEASRNPMTSVGSIEGKYMSAKPTNILDALLSFGSDRKYRKLDQTILNNTKNEADEYKKAAWEATKAKTEKNAILFRGSREKAAKESMEAHRETGRKLADAISSVSVQYINENFKESERERAKAWVYSQYATDKQVRVHFDEYGQND